VEEDFVSMKDTFCKILLFIFELFIHYKHTLLHFLGVDLRAALGVVWATNSAVVFKPKDGLWSSTVTGAGA